ncbi:NUDIX domain-containing protein [Alteribacillus persepolensis]|uniref:NUDIX domain-containing protein n=1 Tax=Alteribacillus persepolensis TaxID=568899 RepID=A0A1G8GU89_9BACI|nr:NUDIX hydrolase [Alteribacillus persepolensis]SDH97978.1 NUDIX domain-containing protein [Alteribacillus persepolensis]
MPVIPKPASTVMLLNDKGEVYLTKRPATMKVLAGFYVFPGGSVEKGDSFMEDTYMMFSNHTIDRTFYIAAARELFEETGVLLCRHQNNGVLPLSAEKKTTYRRQLLEKHITFLQLLQQENLYLDCRQLMYVGQRITPPYRPYRFDTRYFIAKLPVKEKPDPLEQEVADACWLTPEEAISLERRGSIPVASPTISYLKKLKAYQQSS